MKTEYFTINNPKFVKSFKEILKLKTRDYFKFKCIKCGKYQIKQVNSPSKYNIHKKMLCTYCLTHVDHSTINNPIFVKNEQDFLKLHKYDAFIFNCKRCKESHIVTSFRRERMRYYKLFLCRSCFAIQLRKERPEIVLKAMETNKKHHNGLHNSQTAENRLNMRIRNLNHPEWRISKNRYKYCDTYFDSAWELALWIYAKDHNEEIIREPIRLEFIYGGKPRKYYPDFKYKGKLIEIKGNHYFLNNDPSKRMIFPYNKIHSNAPLLTPKEKQYMDDLYEAKHQCGLKHGVEFWSKKEMEPYMKYIDSKYGSSYLVQFKLKK